MQALQSLASESEGKTAAKHVNVENVFRKKPGYFNFARTLFRFKTFYLLINFDFLKASFLSLQNIILQNQHRNRCSNISFARKSNEKRKKFQSILNISAKHTHTSSAPLGALGETTAQQKKTLAPNFPN